MAALKTATITSEKNLHAYVPPMLLERARAAAEHEQISLDQLVSEAMERSLNRQELEKIIAFGKRHSQGRGLKPADVDRAIAEVRAGAHKHRQS